MQPCLVQDYGAAYNNESVRKQDFLPPGFLAPHPIGLRQTPCEAFAQDRRLD